MDSSVIGWSQKAWITPADDLGKLLQDSGGAIFGKDGRWVLTNGPDIAPLKRKNL
jgi:hypothetical protein